MAEKKDDISKDAAANLQKAAQALATVSEKMAKVFAKGADFAKAMTKEVNETAKGAKTAEEYFDGIKNLTSDLASELERNAEQQKIQNNALATGNSIAVATLTLEKEKAILLAQANGMAQSLIDKMSDEYDAAIQMTTEYEKQVAEREAASDLADKLQQQQDQLMDSLKEITGYEGVFEEIFTDGRLAAGVFVNQLLKGVKNTKELFNSAREEGLTFTQSVGESATALSDSFSLTGTSAKDSMEVMSAMREELGSIEEVTRSARLEAASLAKTFGISNQEAAQLTAQLSTMPGETMDSANNTAEFAGNMAKAAGVAPGAVLKDMAKNSEAVAAYGKDGGKNMAVMAVAAKKVGVEMGSIVNAAEQLLDFESSIEKQMEASVLLGREINLDKARQLALEGDLAGATKEMLANVGGEAEFNKMNAIQRKALADSMGVSVSELQKMVKNQDALTDLTQEQQEALAAGETTMDELAANAGGFGSKMLEAGTTITSGIVGLGEMTNGLKEGVAAAKDLGKGLMNIVSGILPKMSASLKSMGGNLKDKFGGIKDKLSGAASKTAEASAAASKTPPGAGKSIGGLTKAIEKIKPGKLLAGAAALVLVAAAVFVFAKAAQEFTEVSWESIGKAIVAMLALVGALALVGMIMMSGVGAVAILAGAGAMLIMAAALFVLGKAIQEMAVGFNMFAPALMELAPMAIQIVALGAGLVLMGAGMLALGAASWFAAPGILLGSVAIGALAVSMLLFGAAMNYAMPGIMMLTQLGSLAPAFGELAMAMWSLAAGITAFATAGLFTLPTIMGLIALSFVAPILTALGDSINYDLGGGNNAQQAPAENKMDVLIEEIRQLRAAFQTPGTINMDGQKVGDVLGLAVSNSGIS